MAPVAAPGTQTVRKAPMPSNPISGTEADHEMSRRPVSTSRSVGGILAMFGLLLASVLPASPLTSGIRYLAVGYVLLDLLLHARTGYLRRRPHWTRDSWRRYFIACALPLGAIAVFACMMVAVEQRLPIVGPPRSTARGLWIVAMMSFMVVGVGGLVSAIAWLAQGEPSRQFPWPRWLARGQRPVD